MHSVWWVVFIVSLSLLGLLLLRSKHSVQWLAYIGLNLVVAGLLLYAVNWFGGSYDYHLPINATTVGVVGVLGVPGLLLLAAIKFAIV